MKDAQKPDHISLNTLIERLREGCFVIPDFQRDFEWRPADIRDLIRSIFLDYYIGSLLLWSGKKANYTALSCEPIYGYEGKSRPQYIVLDGQQRLTAMYYVFHAPDTPLPTRSNRYYYYVRVDKFMAEEHDAAFEYDWSKRFYKLIANREQQFAENIFPLHLLCQGGRELILWEINYEKYWQEQAEAALASGDTELLTRANLNAQNAKAFGEYLRTLTDQYQISYIELDQDLSIDKVCDIFTQINSKGVQLDTFDLMNAMLKPKGMQLKKMWQETRARLDFVETGKMNVYVLQVMSILRQAYCSPKYLYFLLPGQEKPIRQPDGTRTKEILIQNIKDFESQWKLAVEAIENSISLLRHPHEFGVISSNYLPYVSILPAFAAIQQHVSTVNPNKQLAAQRKARYWYWASVFMNRYSGSVESTAARDFLDMKLWLENDENEPGFVLHFKNGFRQLDLRKETKRGSSVYNGIFNMLVIQGARDWMTGNTPQHGDLDDHHIIPASKITKLGVGNLIHSILNRTPMTAATNRKVIRDRFPYEYLPDLIKENGENTVRGILESHFISPVAFDILLRNPFKAEDFEDFIKEREQTLIKAIQNLLIKERLDLPPDLREIDQKIEQVEVALRKCISMAIDNDPNKLPSNILEKADQRIQQKIRKVPGIDIEEYQQLDKRLEHCDLQELKEIIHNKVLWPAFESRFKTKEALAGRFSQLGELRNTIRHSRSVDKLTRTDGEAAILWFEQALTSC